ncbi:MAG: hypothetical protein DDT26_01987 [Dehalococcoidia bacterium]|nr:hypothetical protein [Chloroflexota bacterium]
MVCVVAGPPVESAVSVYVKVPANSRLSVANQFKKSLYALRFSLAG